MRKESKDLTYIIKGDIINIEDDVIVEVQDKKNFDSQNIDEMCEEIKQWILDREGSTVDCKVILKETSDGKLGE